MDHLHVFSGQGDRIEMIPFAMGQASLDTILPTTYYSKNFEISPFLTPPLGTPKGEFAQPNGPWYGHLPGYIVWLADWKVLS